ncbi:MAG: PQQ-binding-like beta-propeller repeat protein [Planctomycetota bacterium]
MSLQPRFLSHVLVLCVSTWIGTSNCSSKETDSTQKAGDASQSQPSWPQWRGVNQDGIAPEGTYPLRWTEKEGVNWSLQLSGTGGSTPVIAGDKAFFTLGAAGNNELVGVDLTSGKIAWQTSIGKDAGGKHRKGSGSNPSAVTDGESVFAYFRSGDLACVSSEGKLRWSKNLQTMFGSDTLWWDLGSSPTLMGDMVIVAVMQSGPSYLVAFDKLSGDIVWKVDRMLNAPEEAAQSYATPVAIPSKDWIAVMGADHLTVHHASDGRELGRVGGFNPDQEKYYRSISSPAVSGDIILCPYSRGSTVTAIRLSDVVAGKGRDSVIWHRDDLGSDVPTPAIVSDRAYFVGDSKTKKGVVWAVDIETGKTVWQTRLPKSRIGFSSSPIVANNHLFVTAENATTYVIGPLDASKPELAETNPLDDSQPFTVASPVPYQDGFLIRTRSSLYRIQ